MAGNSGGTILNSKGGRSAAFAVSEIGGAGLWFRPGLQAFNARSLFQPALCRSVHGEIFPLAYGHNNDNDALVVNLVDKPVTGVFQFDLVAVVHAGKPGRSDTWPFQTFGQLFLELLADRAVEFLPLLEGRFFELETIGHRGKP